MANIFLNCPVDCDESVLLPAIPVEQDCTSYPVELSQVCDLYIRPDGAGDLFADWSTTPTATVGGIDNTITDNTKGKWLVGIGGVAVAEKTTTEYPKGKSKTSKRTYPLTFTVLNMSVPQYDFLRKLQCGDTSVKVYYADLAGKLYGKAGGLEITYLDVDFPKGEGNTDTNKAIITMKWDADGDPDKRVNPLATV